MDTPRQFFDAFVKPSYEAWLKKPPALLLASCAVHQANVMVERLVRYEFRSETLATRQFDAKVRKRRAEIAKAHPDFALVVDIDDAHKHLELRDRDRAVTSSKQTAIRHIGGSWAGSWAAPGAHPGALSVKQQFSWTMTLNNDRSPKSSRTSSRCGIVFCLSASGEPPSRRGPVRRKGADGNRGTHQGQIRQQVAGQ